MAALARVMTVDAERTASRLVRSALELVGTSTIQVDMPGSQEALDELGRAEYRLLVIAPASDQGNADALDLARRAREQSPDTAIIFLGSQANLEAPQDGPDVSSPFVFLPRPVDPHVFLRAITSALEQRDSLNAVAAPEAVAVPDERAPVPPLDLKAAQVIIDALLVDVGAKAIVLSTRAGDVLLERGAAGLLDRDRLTTALLPTLHASIALGDLIGGHPAALHYFDGQDFDIFVLSLGFHHFISLIFDGQSGARQFGAVSRFGRRAAEDLKALIGARAYALQPGPVETGPLSDLPPTPPEPVAAEPLEPVAVKADTWEDTAPPPPPEANLPRFQPIPEFDPSIFDRLDTVDTAVADDLFDPERLAELAGDTRHGRGPISYDEARELGIVP